MEGTACFKKTNKLPGGPPLWALECTEPGLATAMVRAILWGLCQAACLWARAQPLQQPDGLHGLSSERLSCCTLLLSGRQEHEVMFELERQLAPNEPHSPTRSPLVPSGRPVKGSCLWVIGRGFLSAVLGPRQPRAGASSISDAITEAFMFTSVQVSQLCSSFLVRTLWVTELLL